MSESNQPATLLRMLENNPTFTSLGSEERAIFTRLALQFEDNELALYLTPKELAEKLLLGNKSQWEKFLQFPAVQAFIKAQLSQFATVASRRAIQSLAKEAQKGDVGAAKQINELAGVLASADSRKVIILHQINRRPIPQSNEEETVQ